MDITVIGTGYVGLVSGTCFANSGNSVVCVDIDQKKIQNLKEGIIPIYEEGLKNIVERNIEENRLHFTTNAEEAVKSSEVIFIAVGTPSDEDGSADLKYVLKVAEEIGTYMNEEKIVVCKSTVPVGTCDKVEEVISSLTEHQISVVSNPEFLKEGTAIQDFQSPDRVVIGSKNKEASKKVGSLYEPFMRRSNRIVYTDIRSAEMIKYASNAMLATKISFINEISGICDKVGANVEEVRTGMSLDERIGPHFIYPGVGFGGSCFPKDVKALGKLGKDHNVSTPMINSVQEVNSSQKLYLYEKAKSFYGSLKGKRFAVWGLSFKPKTDDIREAPSIENIESFLKDGASVSATDPEALKNASKHFQKEGRVEFFEDEYKALENVDGLFIFTEWEKYRNPDFDTLLKKMDLPVIFDGRNLYDPKEMNSKGFEYFSVGRPKY